MTYYFLILARKVFRRSFLESKISEGVPSISIFPSSINRELSYLDKNKFDVVVVSLIAGYYQYQKMKSLSKAINNSKNRPYYIMGGYGPTPEPEFFLKKSGCDVVCMGEGEITVKKLMDAIENKTSLRNVPGIAWLEDGKLQQTPRAPLIHNLDSLEWAPYELFDMKHYRMHRLQKNKPTDFCMPMMSARGCSFKCTFCYRMDPGYRMRDPKPMRQKDMDTAGTFSR